MIVAIAVIAGGAGVLMWGMSRLMLALETVRVGRMEYPPHLTT